MTRLRLFLLGFMIALLLPFPAAAFKIHRSYESSRPLQTLNGPEGEKLVLERARVQDVIPAGIERIQVRNSNGRIVAYTPARVSALPFCFGRNTCWIFMWKTVYPFPAIFKFIPDRETWTTEPHPPLQYSRFGYPGEGFEEKFNLLLGAVGVYLFFVEHAWYFCCCIFFTIAMCLQITKYRDLPEAQQKWIQRIIGMMAGIWHIPFPVEPYIITATLLAGLGFFGMRWLGIPFVLSMATVFVAFFVCSMRLAKNKLRKQQQAAQ